MESQIRYYTIRQEEAKELYNDYQKNRKINKDGRYTKLGTAEKRKYNELLRDYKATTFFLTNYNNEKKGKPKFTIPEFEKIFQEETGIDPKPLK